MIIPLVITFYILFPVLVIYICHRFSFFRKLGAVIVCYMAGIALGNSGLLPPDIVSYQERTADLAVALALPLLLFSIDIRKWARLAGTAVLSMFWAIVSIVIISFTGFIFLNSRTPDAWKYAGMAIGVYTGGTPNVASIKAALQVDSSTFIVFHTWDTVISAIYIIFVITAARRLFLLFLPPFRSKLTNDADQGGRVDLETEDIDSYGGILRKEILVPLIGAFLVSVLILLSARAVTLVLPEDFAMSGAILTITTLGIGCSFIRPIRRIKRSFQLGMYIILIFCLVVGSMANLEKVINVDPAIMYYVVFSIFGSMMLHAVFCRIFRIDADTFLITSVSAICSPPFVPVVAGALKNREIILSGLTTGIIGYAVGNYLGISLAYLYRSLF